MNINEQIAVMQHYANGGKVEYKSNGESTDCPTSWTFCHNPKWNWGAADYRIKKEPRKFEVAVRKSDGGIVNIDRYGNRTWCMNRPFDYEIITVTEDV